MEEGRLEFPISSLFLDQLDPPSLGALLAYITYIFFLEIEAKVK